MYRIAFIIGMLINSCFYAQQNENFEEVKKYYDYHRYRISEELKVKFKEESNVIKKSQIENTFFDIMKKVDSAENNAYIQALITTKNKEDLKLIFAEKPKVKTSKKTLYSRKKKKNKKSSVVKSVIKEAQYPGGIDALRKELANSFYLSAIKEDLKNASTVISFIVEKDGSITYVKAEGEDAGFNTQAEIAVYRLKHKFIPANVNGKPEQFKFRIPLNMNFE